MTLIEILMILVLAPFGLVAIICSIGWWATTRYRLEHTREMERINDQKKLTAITVREREINVDRTLNAYYDRVSK